MDGDLMRGGRAGRNQQVVLLMMHAVGHDAEKPETTNLHDVNGIGYRNVQNCTVWVVIGSTWPS